MPTTIILVDDHPIFRQGLHHLLSKEKDMSIVGEASDGQMAIEQVRQKKPDLVVMDINMPNMDGIEATRKILSEAPETRVVALSVHSGKPFVRDMIEAGASGYILKESIPEEMITGIRTALSGDIYLSSTISKTLVADYREMVSETSARPDHAPGHVLYTKLHRPQISATIIPRTRLITTIEKHVQNSMTLIAAPAGYGKSILASQWLEISQLPGGWVSLDENDNHLRLFLRYVVEGIQGAGVCQELKINSLALGTKLPSAKEIGQYLLNDLESCSGPFALVLDDYHHIHNEAIHDLITELLIHPSHLLHLVVVTRRDPPLPLTSLRAGGVLTEITPADLRFTAMETKRYLERFLQLEIADETALLLEEKMEGWVTGLHLAALSMKHETDQQRLTNGLKGTSLYVQEYLIQEVLSHAHHAYKTYLLQTSILNKFCASLCDTIIAESSDAAQADSMVNGREFINWLINMNFFVIPLDEKGEWFRYHHFFQQLLQDQLQRHQDSEQIAGLHLRASEWFAQNHYVEDAIRHAILAGEPMKATQFIGQNRHIVMNEDQWYAMETWLFLMPEDVIETNPDLLMVKTWLMYHHFSVAKIPALIDAAEALLSESPNDRSIQGEIEFFRGYFCFFQNNGQESLKHLIDARELVLEEHREICGQIEILYGLTLQMEGQQDTALNRLGRLLDHPKWEKSVARTRLLATPVFIHIISGNLALATTANQHLYNFTEMSEYAYAKAWSVYLSGLIHFYRNELKEAIEHFNIAIEQKYILQTRAVIDSMAGLVYAYQALGRSDSAKDILKDMIKFIGPLSDPADFLIARACEARLTIMQGQNKSLTGFLRGDPAPAENMIWWLEIPAVTYCRALIAEGSRKNFEKSEAMLHELLQLNQDNHNTCHGIQALTLLAMVCAKQGRSDKALAFLKRAVVESAPGGFIRPFVELGPPMADLLVCLRRKSDPIEGIDDLLTAFDDAAPGMIPVTDEPPSTPDTPATRPSARFQPQVEPLTNREMDVIELLAKRYQTKEIANKMSVSPETVKSHLKNIYQKLNVSDRRKAVKEARQLGVI